MSWRPPRHLALAAIALLPLVGAACGGGDADDGSSDKAADPGTVKVIDNEFEPSTVEVAPGDTVTWTFEGAVQHNVTGEGDFKSETQKDGEYERQFNSAGEYEYVCTLHPGMKGKVVVG